MKPLYQRTSTTLLILFPLLLHAARAQQKLESCKPVSERTGTDGCWIMASTPLGKLPDAPVFWTLDTYPTRAAAEAAASKGSTVVEALGKIWLFTVGERANVPTAGTRVSQIGPLPLTPNQEYTAQYRESIMQPGAISRTHLHSGPEIFYTEAGETCLETPTGKQLGKKGVDVIIPEGAPMELMATGTEARRSLVLVLHNSSKPHTTLVTDWKSKGLCQASQPPAP